MKSRHFCWALTAALAWTASAADPAPPPVFQAPPAAQPVANPASAAPQTAASRVQVVTPSAPDAAAPAAPASTPAPPPSAAAKLSAADLEKLAQPIALHPDPLIAILLPASVYPVEVVQAARFVKDTNNIAKVDQQPWDENVKAVAKIPALINQMDTNLNWTVQLGQAFLDQPKELMDVIQALRAKAQKAGTLQTTPQQVVVVTNVLVEKTVEQQVVVVTNTVVQIQPANPQVVYVPSYPPTVYYPPPAYVYDPWAPLVTFGVGMAVGAIIANNCDWHHGGVYVGHHGVAVWGGGYGDVDINVNNNFNQNVNVNNPGGSSGTRPSNPGSGARPPGATSPGGRPPTASTMPAQKWQPDQSRLKTSGAPSATTREARGWGSNGGAGGAAARPSTGAIGAGPSTGSVGARPSTGAVGTRPSTGSPSVSRPAASPSISQPRSPSPSNVRPSPSTGARDSAFSGAGGGGNTRDFSSRGSSSRSSGFSGGSRSGGFSGGSRGGFGGGGRGGRR